MKKCSILFLVGFTLPLMACSTLYRPTLSKAELQVMANQARSDERRRIDQIINTLVERTQKNNTGQIDILLLSGGGQNGAYGIGFLKAWQSRTYDPMPKFDLVTGVSTGSLQAPFVLKGTKEALESASQMYLSSATEFAPSFDWTFWLQQTGGIVKTDRYEKMLRSVFNEDFKNDLNKEFSEGRQLVVATANYDLGVGRTWLINEEINKEKIGLERVHKILLASTTIPAIFPTQIIDGQIQSDGGVVCSTLPLLNFEDYQTLSKRLTEVGVTKPINIRLWVIMNYWLYPNLEFTDPSSQSAMAKRRNKFLFVLAQPQMLQRLNELSFAVSSIPNMTMTFKSTAIPSELANEPGAQELFNQKWMKRLEALGEERAGSLEPWDKLEPAFARPEIREQTPSAH